MPNNQVKDVVIRLAQGTLIFCGGDACVGCWLWCVCVNIT